MTTPRPVLVVDFGAQYAQLIARRVREAEGLLRDRAALDAGRRDAGEGPGRDHPVRRPVQRVRARRPAGRRGAVRRRRAGLRHLLRLPGDGPGARRHGGAHRAARVRRHAADRRRRRRRAAARPAGRAAGLDEPRRLRRRGPRGLHGDRRVGRARRWPRSRTSPAGGPACSSTRRSAHTAHGPGDADPLPLRHRRHRADLDAREHHRRAGRRDPGPGRRQGGDLRALRRGRLGGRRGAGAQARSATSSPASSSTTGCCAPARPSRSRRTTSRRPASGSRWSTRPTGSWARWPA